MRILYILLSLLIFQNVYADNTKENTSLTVLKKNSAYGVKQIVNGNASVLIEPTYDYVNIIDSINMIEVRRYCLTPGDTLKRLPAPVIEFYDLEGNFLQRNVSMLIEADPNETMCRAYQKQYFSPEMDIALMTKEAMKELSVNRRREAYQKYMAIYKKYPKFEHAKNEADKIKQAIHDERLEVRAQLSRERAEQQAALKDLAVSLQSLSNSLAQIQTSRQSSSSTSSTTRTTKTTQTANRTTKSTSSTNRSASSTSASRQQKTTRPSSSNKSHFWSLEKKRIKCTLCNGSGKCSCHNGKILGHVIRECNSCKGSGICPRCKGAKTILY